jgi:outer membrane receptor for ferrienterochelin and colicins
MVWIVWLFAIMSVEGQKKNNTDANVFGHVTCCGEHLPYVTLVVKGTTMGTMTDATGHYMLTGLPPGKVILQARSLGYKPAEKDVVAEAGKTLEVNFELQEDVLGMEAVVVTGSRSGEKRSRSAVIINTVSPKLFSAIQSVQIREGLDFCPGLRTETDCQNCGFSQLRINGMEGAYSQVLINGHPVFSSLAGVYGLELLPSNMIERIEVIRGGGSALYGSNAIAGTVNILLKDPLSNTFSVTCAGGGVGTGVPGSGPAAGDMTIQTNASVVSDDRKAGMTLFANYQNRGHFDANDDGFSEIPELNNITFGIRGYHRIGYHNKLTLDLFHIAEQRRGGGPFGVPPHEAAIAEAIRHGITSGSLTWDLFLTDHGKLSTFFSGQNIDRDSYYGAEYSLKDYGHTDNFTYVAGSQYEKAWGVWKMTAGAEMRGESLQDKKLGYPDYDHAVIRGDSIVTVPHMPDVPVADQRSYTAGVFLQGECRLARWTFSAGMRYDHYDISDDLQPDNDNKGDVISPRINVKVDVTPLLQLRGSVSTGYRAPQIFDEDLHIASSGSRQVIIRNDPHLQQEKSRSYGLSAYLHREEGKVPFEILVEGFYTRLLNPFVNDIGLPDENGVVYYTRRNAAAGALVRGVNLEVNLIPVKRVNIRSGFTLQESRYEEPYDFGETRFFRTPASYGYILADVDLMPDMDLSFTYNYTGRMLVPYFGPEQSDPARGMLKKSESFHNVGMKISHTVKLNGTKIRFFISVKNIFNAWQRDFDRGIDRDPAYIYGPAYPRSFYAGVRFGNIL